MKALITTTLAGAALLLLASCSQQAPESAESAKPTTAPAAQAAFPAELTLASAPATDKTAITALKADAKAGDEVTVDVFVGGRSKPFVDNVAVMTVVDAALPNPCMAEDDHCPKPWDYCCSNTEELTTNMATIRVVDNAGKPLAADFTKAQIKPGDRITVTATIAEKNDDGLLILNATGIHKQ